MVGRYIYPPDIWPSFFTTILLVVLSVYAWRRRSEPGALPFAVGSLFASLWAAGTLAETAALDPTTQIFWIKFQATWQLPAVSAIACFVLEYAWPGRWLTRRNLALLAIPPLLFLVLILTNDLHHLAWRGFLLAETIIPRRGPANWIFIAYGYALGLLELAVFAWLFRRSPQHRWPVAVMATGLIGARALYLFDAAGVVQSNLPADVLLLAYLFLMYAIALFRFRILDPLPFAREAIIAQMRGGVLVLDAQGLVASVNPAAEAILGLPARQILGHPLARLLPTCTAALADLAPVGIAETEICLGKGPEARYYALECSPLKDWRGLDVGRLLLLRDVTAQKQAQAQLIQQQRTLATLRERERLARELHDSLGQTLASAHLQASTARLLLARGETAQTDGCLEEMAKMTMAAETDVREYLLGAKTVFSDDLPFFPALGRYLAQFSRQYDLPVTLHVPTHLEAEGLEPATELQMMRIIQEALSNIRKHARARTVQVEFLDSRSQLQLVICDDGLGFDPDVLKSRAGGFGLQAMRERAEEIGGSFLVRSRPGHGTRVVVQMPGNGAHGEDL